MNTVSDSAAPVLVVDDDRLALLTLSHGLRGAGLQVVEADNGDDAILLARRHRPRLAVLDIRMQGLSGFDVAQYLRDYTLTPFLFLSAFTDEATREQAMELGALACLEKPVSLPDLLQRIAQALTAMPLGESLGPADRSDPSRQVVTGRGGWPVAAVAVGLLMHRHGLNRDAAARRLQDLAAAHGRGLEQTAEDLLRAQELLAASGPLGAAF